MPVNYQHGFVIVNRSWTNFKKVIIGPEKKLRLQYESESDRYRIFALDESILYECDIFFNGQTPSTWSEEEITENTGFRTEFEANHKASGNKPLIVVDADGNVNNVSQPRPGSKFNVITHNWCDKTTWYSESTKITAETLSDSGNGLTFNSAHAFWVDMKHGKVTDEDSICAINAKWLSTITINNVAKTESPPGTTSGDYQIDYRAGTVTFNASQSGNTVVATYWYAGSGSFTFKPLAGKKIKLLSVEVQFSTDLDLKDTLIFTPYGYAGVFAPQYVPTPYAATDLIPLAPSNKYKRIWDFINEANGTYPLVPVTGGNSWRGMTQPVITFPWNYIARTDIFSSYGMEIRISMENNIEQGGELATATFYAISENE
jgi:hypothetical protein